LDWGNVAQWVAIAISLTIGVRADRRAKRAEQRDLREHLSARAVALQNLVEYLDKAIQLFPEAHDDVRPWSPTALKTLRTLNENALPLVGTGFPDTVGHFFTIGEALSELESRLDTDPRVAGKDALKTLSAVYQEYRILCITAALRIPLQGRDLTPAALAADRYRAAFESRYQRVRERRRTLIEQS
jgi:hypothetical protein